ncbi:MAG: hypothetical protein GY862_26730 [Gammaproteobacteria bacterium]|nr:hypothetical protein [Gammaproteobacteria bacterium]
MIIPEIQDYLRESKNNVKRMRWHIHTFVKQSFAGLSVVEKFQQEQYKLLTSCEDLERIEIEIQQFYGDGEKNRQEMEKLTELLREARNVRETLQDLLADSKTQCTNQD